MLKIDIDKVPLDTDLLLVQRLHHTRTTVSQRLIEAHMIRGYLLPIVDRPLLTDCSVSHSKAAIARQSPFEDVPEALRFRFSLA